jgi:hypothetical protein
MLLGAGNESEDASYPFTNSRRNSSTLTVSDRNYLMVPMGSKVKTQLNIKRNGAGNYYQTPLKEVNEEDQGHKILSR